MEIENYSNDCELVLGLVAPVGINLEDVKNRLKSFIEQFRYELNYIHLSEIAAQYCEKVGESETEDVRIRRGMNNGNELRRKSERGDIFSLFAINEINKKREKNGIDVKPLGRVIHVIRSLKHPDEVETLRQVYGHGFFLLAISSTIDSRKKYLQSEKGVNEPELSRLIERDDKEKTEDNFGQSTRDVFQMADAFITTDDEEEELSDQVARTMDLLFSKPVVTPTSDEYAMFMAYAASLRSADLSRQVGAVIANEDFDILSTGANDVPKYGGGLYWPDINDKRDHVLGNDANEIQKNNIIIEIMKKFDTSDKTDALLLSEGKNHLSDTGLLDITEYGRAVHAEMEALLSCARNGIATRGTTLYTTTFPCHNCTKHMVAAGVTNVKYIEPYPKSYATKLHSDSVCADSEQDREEKVVFEPFVGIGPRRFVDLFSTSLGSGRKLIRKVDGELRKWNRTGSELRVPMTPFSYIDSETMLASQLGEIDLTGE